ncbi:MAG: M28 family peptidase [Verrucomicrobiales bacterium]|nr:M28 family peptidase [Verrucomicrobiales bacterium]
MKFLKFLGWLIVIVMTLAAGGLLFIWVFLAQPSLKRSSPSDVSVSPVNLEAHVRKLAIEFSPRNAAHIGNTNRTADYIKQQFEGIYAPGVSEQRFQVGSYRYRNVSLLIGNPEDERIVIGAHYDGFGPYQAADDNASGVAGLIELARLCANHDFGTAIEFVAYPLEEPPYFGTGNMGSARHASDIAAQGRACRFMISLEMIGYFSDEPDSQKYPHPLLYLFYPSKGNFITVVGNTENRRLTKSIKTGMKGATSLKVRSLCGPASIPGIDFSDHRNYWATGVPAVMVTDTAFYRNLAYHTSGDTADRLDYKKMAMVVVGVYEALQQNRHF